MDSQSPSYWTKKDDRHITEIFVRIDQFKDKIIFKNSKKYYLFLFYYHLFSQTIEQKGGISI